MRAFDAPRNIQTSRTFLVKSDEPCLVKVCVSSRSNDAGNRQGRARVGKNTQTGIAGVLDVVPKVFEKTIAQFAPDRALRFRLFQTQQHVIHAPHAGIERTPDVSRSFQLQGANSRVFAHVFRRVLSPEREAGRVAVVGAPKSENGRTTDVRRAIELLLLAV